MKSAYSTRKSAVAAVRQDDSGGWVVIDGKGPDPQHAWGVFDAGTAEDLLADDIGRKKARALLAAKWVITWADYHAD